MFTGAAGGFVLSYLNGSIPLSISNVNTSALFLSRDTTCARPSSLLISPYTHPSPPQSGETQLALKWRKEENFAMWYSDVIVLSEMISYYDISGCYILRPWSYKIWELIQDWFNIQIKKLGVENSYFPMFVSQDRLEKEKDHVEGFAPEVAWVTRSGDGELAQPIAVRPTSETIMYPAFADWIRSHRDLPLKLNQWSNVVRWEFKDPTPFLRTREFLWQEGHTAHASYEDADVMVMQALDLYRRVYEELLAIPVIPGYKTEKEKFAGGHQTTTVEAYIPVSGRAIQGATSHNLGQNFGKMFDINYQDEKGETKIAWQTSWGLTTRTIGVMIMVHGDDTGLVLPPMVAPQQAVIIPIVSKSCPLENLSGYCEDILKSLEEKGIRAKLDDRLIYNPGWKYAHWEQKGVPIRIEVGPRDLEKRQARMVVRFGGEKIDVSVDTIASDIEKKLKEVQANMLAKASEFRDNHLVQVTEWKDFVPNLELHNLVLTPWCGGEHTEWEEWVKEKSREESLQSRGEEGEDDRAATSVAAKTLCIPFKQPELKEGTKCIASGLPATCWVLWGRSY
jgi:prolyl-tRNA synthetase